MIARVRHDACRVTGRDAASYLHSQASNDISSLAVGSSCYAFFLDPGGKVVSLVRVTRLAADDFLLDLDRGGLADLLPRLERFKIRVAVNVEPVELTCESHRGSRPASVDPTGICVDAWWGDEDSVDVLFVDDTSGSDTSSELEAERVGSAWPRLGSEIEPGSTFPAATGVVSRAVSFTKGCYPGQELVERMDSRGADAPFSLRRIDDAAGLVVGHEIVREGVIVGTVTSVAGGRALAYVRRNVDI